jgi:WD40 repeat protein
MDSHSTTIIAPLYVLEAHRARVFSVLWSPLVAGLLASGSDDQLILIWEVLQTSDQSRLTLTGPCHGSVITDSRFC